MHVDLPIQFRLLILITFGLELGDLLRGFLLLLLLLIICYNFFVGLRSMFGSFLLGSSISGQTWNTCQRQPGFMLNGPSFHCGLIWPQDIAWFLRKASLLQLFQESA